ncbi:MAG: hypothetical protein ACQCXQ_03750 [Verrucomicrobiales bacterium]|nr:hypothetical protein [Verrucomicrobiota bacterium JB025]
MDGRVLSELAEASRKLRAVELSLVIPPVMIGGAWLAFPLLDGWNLGFSVWHGCCVVGVLLAGVGIGCGLVQRWSGGARAPWWMLMIGAVHVAGGSVVLLFGDFYWAFERGFFLD